jgi:dihydrolipoamide dehydrogenase
MSDKKYDLIIIGAGPGGYRAAERAGVIGKKTLLIEKDKDLGGVCLNKGCIPTKALLNSAKIFYSAQNSQQLGVSVSGVEYDLKKAMEWKAKAVSTLTKGVEYQMKRYNVEVITGTAKFRRRNVITVGSEEYSAENIIIATGSSPVKLSVPGADSPLVLTSDEILEIEKLPKDLTIIGGGVIGIEFASYFTLLGIHVKIIEFLPEILSNFDRDIAALIRSSIKHCNFVTGAKVISIENNKINFIKDGKEESYQTDLILLAVGRKPNVENFGLENINVDFDKSGIKVNERMQTNIPNIYAIGDVTGKSLLAHSAYRMGEVAVNNMYGKKDKMRYNAIPWVVYSYPELSGVGLTEDQAKKEGRKVKVSSLQMRANGRFVAEHGNEKGICKVIVDQDSNVLLGVTLLGGVNSEIIYGAAAMIESEFRVKDIKDIVFPHPTISEIIKDTLWELN